MRRAELRRIHNSVLMSSQREQSNVAQQLFSRAAPAAFFLLYCIPRKGTLVAKVTLLYYLGSFYWMSRSPVHAVINTELQWLSETIQQHQTVKGCSFFFDALSVWCLMGHFFFFVKLQTLLIKCREKRERYTANGCWRKGCFECTLSPASSSRMFTGFLTYLINSAHIPRSSSHGFPPWTTHVGEIVKIPEFTPSPHKHKPLKPHGVRVCVGMHMYECVHLLSSRTGCWGSKGRVKGQSLTK